MLRLAIASPALPPAPATASRPEPR